MKNIDAFLSDLNKLDVKLWEEEGDLCYNAPQGTITPALRTELVERKPEILTFLRQANLATRSDRPPIRPVPRDETLPLSFAQQRLWFLGQLEGSSATYNIPGAVRLVGPLHLIALEKSLTEIVQRHETLRTTFPTVNGTPIQKINPFEDTPPAPLQKGGLKSSLKRGFRGVLRLVDLQTLPSETTEVQRLATEEAQRPFDLVEGPLLRTTLLQLGPQEHVLLVTMHHIISDGWSLGIFIRELSILYEAFSQDKPSPLPPLPIQYADFAAWQRQWLNGEVLEQQVNYWKHQLAEAPALLELPTDHPRPPVQLFQGATCSLQLSTELTAQLKSLSQQTGSTLFMTLLSAFATLLARYTGSEDIVIGSPIANRTQSQIESLIGFFVNTLVLRIELSGNPTFEELLKRVKQVALDAYAHQDIPFEQLVEELQPERNLSHTPLFQVMFVLQNAPIGDLELSGLTLAPVERKSVIAKFDLTLSLEETAEGLKGTLEYNTELFERATIERLSAHFQTLLTGIVANPLDPIDELPFLTEAEHRQLKAWNDTATDYPVDKCIHQLFEAQVERTPDAIALVFENQQLTYQELNAKANQLAHYLQSLGVKPEVLVGIVVERSVEMVIGLLGILKAGGAYVPIDPSYPAVRLAFMAEDSGVPVLLTHSSLQEQLPNTTARVVYLDAERETLLRLSAENLIPLIRPENLAYVIYTSGSTGKPKGTMITHQGLLNYISWCTKAYQVAKGKGSVVHSSIGFDATITSLFSPLVVGKKVVLLPEAQEIDALSATLSSGDVNLIKITPAHLEILGQLLSPEDIKGKALTIIIGGEALLGKTLSFWKNNTPHIQLINEYGPTETVVGCCVYEVTAQTSLVGAIPIGRPIANTQLYILDHHLQLVPVGVPGELHIGGAGLARGYLNRPDLTAAYFIPLPFNNEPGYRLYKTGDLARYLPDGKIEFLGRIDNQVKIRGFRIELGEIETVLAQHPHVRETVVISTSVQKRLVAYLVSDEKPVPKNSELRDFLKEKLPNYMLPSFFVWLEAFPLAPSGKIDRSALPAPQTTPAEQSVAPRTTTEKILAEIWADVLGLQQVGIYDNFFERGGDSLLSIQVVAKANQAGLQITPNALFQHQTIAELVPVANTSATREAEQALVTGAVPLTPIQHWFFEQNLPEPHHYNQSVLLQGPHDINPILLAQIVQHWQQHHNTLRLRFTKEASVWQATQVALVEEIPFQVIDLSTLPLQTQRNALERAAELQQASLNLSDGPLMRVVLFPMGVAQQNRLLIIIHHLAIDGVSWRILLEDLQTAYHQLSQGEVIQLPPKTTSFQTWSYRLMDYAQSPAVMAELDYWLALTDTTTHLHLDNLPPQGPSNHLMAHNTVASSKQITVSLTMEQTRALLKEVPKAYKTQINDVILTALVQSFASWTGTYTLFIDLEGHGREYLFDDIDLSRTVGWFTNIFPVRLNLGFANSPGDALKSIKEQLRRIPKQGIGYGILRYLNPDTAAQLKKQSQAEICFNYLGQFDQQLSGNSLFRKAKEDSGRMRSSLGNRRYLIEINGFIIEEQFQLDWNYSENLHKRTTIEQLAQRFIDALQTLIAHCQSLDAGGYTPSDFLSSKLSQKSLDTLMTQLNQTNQK